MTDSLIDLIAEIDLTLDYFQTEFPALANEKNRQVWADPISYHCGGISPDDLMKIRNILTQPSEIPLVSKKHVRDLMVEAAKRIPLDMQYKTSAQIDAMLEAIEPYLAISKPVSVDDLAMLLVNRCRRACNEEPTTLEHMRSTQEFRNQLSEYRADVKTVLDAAGVKYVG